MPSPKRTAISVRARVFGSNSMHAVLRELARRAAETGERPRFHGAELARTISYTRAQTQRELAKLRAIGVVHPSGHAGRTEQLEVADGDVAATLLAFVRALDSVEIGRSATGRG